MASAAMWSTPLLHMQQAHLVVCRSSTPRVSHSFRPSISTRDLLVDLGLLRHFVADRRYPFVVQSLLPLVHSHFGSSQFGSWCGRSLYGRCLGKEASPSPCLSAPLHARWSCVLGCACALGAAVARTAPPVARQLARLFLLSCGDGSPRVALTT